MIMPDHSTRRVHRGYTTLIMSMVLLLLTVLVAYYASGSALLEQRMSANQMRSKQAFAAAQAGIEQALDYMKNGGICKTTACQGTAVGGANATTPDVVTPASLNSNAVYRVAYCSATVTPPACPTDVPTPNAFAASCTYPVSFTKVTAFSCGWSDDHAAVHRIVIGISGTPAIPAGKSPPAPLLSIGTANLLTGGATIMNYFNDLTVWSGANFLGQSMTGKTFIRDTVNYPTPVTSVDYRNTGSSPACNNPPTGYVCSTQGSTTGFDVIQGDTSLSTLTADTLFQGSFGTSQGTWRDTVAQYSIDLNHTLANPTSTDINSLYSSTINSNDSIKSIWIEGNASITGTVGSASNPKIIIVNGDLSLTSGAIINGIIFVTGNLTANGTPTVYGSVSVAGTSSATGNMKIIYDNFNSVSGPGYGGSGSPTKVNGSWKDW